MSHPANDIFFENLTELQDWKNCHETVREHFEDLDYQANEAWEDLENE